LDKVVNLMLRVLTAEVSTRPARDIKLSGDINAKVDNATVDELLAKIREEYKKLGPLIDLEVLREPQGSAQRLILTGASARSDWGRELAHTRAFGDKFFDRAGCEIRASYASDALPRHWAHSWPLVRRA
jgi:hypothetical protein